MKTRLAAPLLALAAGGAIAVAILGTTQTGCSGQACTIDPFHPDEPNATIECPAGQLCYQGQCIRGCNAGQEQLEMCGSDDDCNSSRPNCLRGLGSQSEQTYCSSCVEGFTCVQTLNICRRIDEVVLPDIPMPPDTIMGPYPLDASFEAEGLRPMQEADTGVDPTATPFTNVLYVEAAQTTDIMTGAASVGSVVVKSWFVGDTEVVGLRWRADFSPPLISSETLIDSLLQPNTCEVRRVETATMANTIAPTDFGQILIETHPDFLRGASVDLIATWNPGTSTYDLNAAVPANYLQFSTYLPFEPGYLSVTGQGLMDVTDGAWPDFGGASDFIHHVPFELRLATQTTDILRGGINVGAAPADLALSFEPFNPNNTSTGRVPGERVAFTVLANNVELYCEVIEATGGDTTLYVPAGILTSFRSAVGTTGTFPLTFERVNYGRPPIDPDISKNKAVDLVVHVSHKFRSVMRLQ